MWSPYPIEKQLDITEIFTFFRLNCKSGYSFLGESHDFWECVCVLSGQLKVTGGERIYIARAGDIVLHKPMELHKLSAEENDAEALIFTFSLTGPLHTFFEEKGFSLSLNQLETVSSLAALLPDALDSSHTLRSRELAPDGFPPEQLQLIATYITTLLLSLYHQHTSVKPFNNPEALLFRDMVTFLKSKLAQSVTVSDLAEHFFISESSVKRIFKKHTGIGVHSYFLKLKIAAAAELLKSEKTVSDISSLLGFCDQSYFSTAFARETGFSPTEYKRQLPPRKILE